MTLPLVLGEFRVGTEPKLRFTPSGMAVSELRAVASSRKKDESTGEWADDKSAWVTVVSFRQLAENVAESIEQGALIVVQGRLHVEDWQDGEGAKRTSVKIVADFIGPSLSRATARMTKNPRREGDAESPRTAEPAASQSWATPPGQDDEPPF